MGTLSVLSTEGDIKISWDPNNPDEVEAVRAQFNTLKEKGYLFFNLKTNERSADFQSELGKARFVKEGATGTPESPDFFTPKDEPKVEPPKEPKPELVKEFDPKAQELVATPLPRGG